MVSTFLTFVFNALAEFCGSGYFIIVVLLLAFFAFECIIRIIKGVVTFNV